MDDPDARASSPAAALDEQIHAERINAVYTHLPISLVGGFVAALFLVAILWNKVENAWLLAWLAGVLAHGVWRLTHVAWFRRTAPSAEKTRRAARLFILGVSGLGAIWGLTAILFFPQIGLEDKTFLCLLLFGVVALSVPSIGLYPLAFNIWASLILVPFILLALASGIRSEILLTIPLVIAFGVSLTFARNTNRLVTEAFRRRFENLALIEQLARQKEIAESANRTKTQFLAAASHDLRQPLQALGLFVATLKSRTKEPETQAVAARIERSMGALEGVLEALLDVSRLDAGVVSPRVERFPVARVLDAAREQFADVAARHRLRFDVAPTRTWCESDPHMLGRIVANLVSNALRYTHRGGVVVGVRRAGPRLRIEVWDTGPGIPADQREQIFHEFVQLENPERSRDKGLGLGLAIVRRLSGLLDHPVALRSVPGRGSTFAVSVPRTPAQAETPLRPEAAGACGALAGRFVLVVDDDAEVREAIERLLELQGAHPVVVAGESAAREALADLGRAPDLIISDYRLSDGAVGIEVLRRLRGTFGAEIPAAILTGDIAPAVLKAVADAGLPILSKPVSAEQLFATLEGLLPAQPAEARAAAAAG
jgi:signal transduction histidine kinase/ActR/RegA family two-component response regulator